MGKGLPDKMGIHATKPFKNLKYREPLHERIQSMESFFEDNKHLLADDSLSINNFIDSLKIWYKRADFAKFEKNDSTMASIHYSTLLNLCFFHIMKGDTDKALNYYTKFKSSYPDTYYSASLSAMISYMINPAKCRSSFSQLDAESKSNLKKNIIFIYQYMAFPDKKLPHLEEFIKFIQSN